MRIVTEQTDISTVLIVLLVVDLVLTAYGVWAFRSAQKACKSMLEKLVATHSKLRDEV